MMPTPGPTGDAMWPADWSQFIPDLLAGALVAGAIGVALWRWQRRVESRHASRLAISAWEVPRMRAQLIVREPAPQTAPSDPEAESLVSKLYAFATEFPIVPWSDAAPGSRELAALRELLRAHAAYDDAGEALSRLVDAALPPVGRGLDSGAREIERQTVLRKLIDDEDSVDDIVRNMLAASGFDTLEARMRSDIERVLGLDEVRGAHSVYLQTYETVRVHYETFRSAIGAKR